MWITGGRISGRGSRMCRDSLALYTSTMLGCHSYNFILIYLSFLLNCSLHKGKRFLLLMLMFQLLTINTCRMNEKNQRRKKQRKGEKRRKGEGKTVPDVAQQKKCLTESQEMLGPASFQPHTSCLNNYVWMSFLSFIK